MAARLDEQSLAAARIEVEKWAPLPQPAEAIAVKGAWDAPGNPTSVAKSKARTSQGFRTGRRQDRLTAQRDQISALFAAG